MTEILVVVAEGRTMGVLRQKAGGRVEFEYEPTWAKHPEAYPLSLSMPLAGRSYPPAVVTPFLWNLLPDSEAILAGWGRRFQVSPGNAFSLLAQVGEDCSGAIQIARPDRLETILRRRARVQWLSEADVAERLRDLRKDAASSRRLSDSGQFSLAGAQPKTALCLRKGRWGVPSGAAATTHILKPSTLDLDGYEANEHFCLGLAERLGLPRARSEVMRFEDQIAIVVERFDRATAGTRVLRLHQEDFCQALSVHPQQKYQNEGGPSAEQVAEVIRSASSAPSEDLLTFLAALLFNWLIVGTDGHAKNYSLLIAPRAQVRLAPLYDVASALPYPRIAFQKTKLAMKIGDKYRVRDIGKHQWTKQAARMKFDPELLLTRLRRMLNALPDESSATLNRCRKDGLSDKVLARLHDSLTKRAAGLAREFGFSEMTTVN